MQKPGDVCENCRDRWEEQSMEPKVLQRLGTTVNHKHIVPACEYCDGDALRVYRSNNPS